MQAHAAMAMLAAVIWQQWCSTRRHDPSAVERVRSLLLPPTSGSSAASNFTS
jgi:hypothetical protein